MKQNELSLNDSEGFYKHNMREILEVFLNFRELFIRYGTKNSTHQNQIRQNSQ